MTIAVDPSILVQPATSAFASFDEAYTRLAPVAYRAAYRLLGDREAALDVAQEAMAKLVPRWAEVAHHPTPEGWAVTVATRIVLGGWRKRSGHGPAPTAGTESPESPAIERADLVAALRRLPRRQREVAVLLYAEVVDPTGNDATDRSGAEPCGTDGHYFSGSTVPAHGSLERVLPVAPTATAAGPHQVRAAWARDTDAGLIHYIQAPPVAVTVTPPPAAPLPTTVG